MSRFDGATPNVFPASGDERIEPAERLARKLHEARILTFSSRNRPPGATPDERRANRPEWLDAQGLKDDDEVSTDAIAAVEYESPDGWLVRWVLAEQVGTLVPRSVTVEPIGRTTPAGGVTANLLRELRPSRAASDAGALTAGDAFERASRDTELTDLFIRFARRDVQSSELPTPKPRRVGRPPLPDEHIATVAQAYLDELPRGRGVLRRLGERFDRTPEAMRDQVRIARDREFLSPAPKSGRKGATAGPRLIEWLSNRSGDQR